MEMMPFHPELEEDSMAQPSFGPRWASLVGEGWRSGLPDLQAASLTLRELQVADAGALCDELNSDEVSRFISPPPANIAGFERFIRWAQAERIGGRYACFAVVPEGQSAPVGIFQIRVLDRRQATAEWGFALGSSHWGTGMFTASARRVIEFAFVQMGLRRLEARACVANVRGTAALRKLGAVCEAVLHQSFERDGERLDQGLWTILREDWLFLKSVGRAGVH